MKIKLNISTKSDIIESINLDINRWRDIMEMSDVLVIGGGPAGLNASLYAARKALSVTLVSTDIGGQMMLTNEIENYGVATAFDALYATGKVNSFKAVEYLDTTTWEGTGVYGIAFDEFNGTKSDSKKLDSGKTRYYYWEVSIKDAGAEKYVSAQNYATNYLASNIQSVKVTYTYMDY